MNEGGELLAQYGVVEFLVQFNEYVKDKKMTEFIKKNEEIVEKIISWKSADLKYEPIREQFEAKKIEEGKKKFIRGFLKII